MTREISCMECVVGRFKDDLCEEKICKRFRRKGSSADFEKMITNMAEVVRCKDCKWHFNGHLCKQLSQYGSIETPPSFYCGFGERREPRK